MEMSDDIIEVGTRGSLGGFGRNIPHYKCEMYF